MDTLPRTTCWLGGDDRSLAPALPLSVYNLIGTMSVKTQNLLSKVRYFAFTSGQPKYAKGGMHAHARCSINGRQFNVFNIHFCQQLKHDYSAGDHGFARTAG